MDQEELKQLVQQSYFRSLTIFNHGGIEPPTTFCKIQNPRFRILQFEKQGDYMQFKGPVCYLMFPEINEELNFAMLYGLDNYKKNNVYICENAKEKVLELLHAYPNMKVYDQKNPPLNLRLSFEENEYLFDKRNMTINMMMNIYPLIYDINIQLYLNEPLDISKHFKPYKILLSDFLFSKITNTSDLTEKRLQDIGYDTKNIKFNYEGSMDLKTLVTNNYFLSVEENGKNIYNIHVKIPVLPKYTILKLSDKKYKEITTDFKNVSELDVCLLKMGSYVIEDDGEKILPIDKDIYTQFEEYNITLLQKIIDKYQWIYDTLILISCKYYDSEYLDVEGIESSSFDVPSPDKGIKRKRYYF
jgi:hypothetical protein